MKKKIFNLKIGDFLFARSGTIGRFGLVDREENAVFASYLIRFRFKYIDNNFLKYYFLSELFKHFLFSNLHGGANKNIHAENIKEPYLVIPTSQEQQKIADFLDKKTAEFDSLVEKKESIITKLEEAKKSLISEIVTGNVRIIKTDRGYELVKRTSDEMKGSGIPVAWGDTKRMECKKNQALNI